MMARSDGNSQAVEQRSHVEMMDVADEERHHGVFVVSLSEETHALYLPHPFHRILRKVSLMALYLIHSYALQIVDGSGKTMCRHIVRSASLKFERQFLKHRLLEAHALYHLSATLIRRHAVEPVLLAVEHSHTSRTIHLVSAERHEVAVQILNVHLEVRNALRTVKHKWHTMFVGYAYHLLHRVYRSQHVAHMRHAHYPGAFAEELPVFVHQDFTLVVHRYHLQTDALLCRLQLPRHDVGVVLHGGNYHLVALAHKLIGKRRHHEVQRLGSSSGEYHLVGRLCVDKRSHLLSCRLMQVGGLLRQVVDTTVNIGVHVEIFISHRIEHTERLLCRCAVVQVYQRLAVHLAAQNRKILTYLVNVVHCRYSFIS